MSRGRGNGRRRENCRFLLEHRAWWRVWSHDPEITPPAKIKSRCLTNCATQAPLFFDFYRTINPNHIFPSANQEAYTLVPIHMPLIKLSLPSVITQTPTFIVSHSYPLPSPCPKCRPQSRSYFSLYWGKPSIDAELDTIFHHIKWHSVLVFVECFHGSACGTALPYDWAVFRPWFWWKFII